MDISLPEQTIGKLTGGIQSELTVQNLSFRIPSYPQIVEHLNMHAHMKEGLLSLDTVNFKLGHSDFHGKGSLSDLPAIFRHQEKPLVLTLDAGADTVILKELVVLDSTRKRKGPGRNLWIPYRTAPGNLCAGADASETAAPRKTRNRAPQHCA